MADLETMYGEDAAQALFMWRFAGVSFGLEARFWWTLLGSLATASLTALGAIVYKVIQERIEDHTWLTNELKDGLPYDGTTSIPGGTRAFGEWGSGKWIWMAYSVAGGAVIALLKFVATLLAGKVFPKLTPALVIEVATLRGHPVHSLFVLLCGAVSIGVGASACAVPVVEIVTRQLR